MHDNECQDELAQILRGVAAHFRSNIHKQAGQKLGIEAPVTANAAMGSSRECLYALFGIYAKQLQNGNHESFSGAYAPSWLAVFQHVATVMYSCMAVE